MSIQKELEIISKDAGKILTKVHDIKVPELYKESKARAADDIKNIINLKDEDYNISYTSIPDLLSLETNPDRLNLIASGVWPTTSKIITSHFTNYREFTKRKHEGVDIGANQGSDLFAWNSGKVVKVGKESSTGGYGNTIQIKHGAGIESFYAHISSSFVSVGQIVNRGQIIGLSGNSGRSTGPHLHFEIKVNGEPVDPIKNGYISQNR